MPAYVDVHTHGAVDTHVLQLFNALPPVFDGDGRRLISVGLHPWHIDPATVRRDLDRLNDAARRPEVVAIGECGLDRLIATPLSVQEPIFREQVAVAEALRKPLILHCVRAHDEVLRILRDITVPAIVHGFNNKQAVADRLLRAGLYLSFGKALLKDGSNAGTVIANCPADRFFLETDDADLSIVDIYEAACHCRGDAIDALQRQIQRNFVEVFGGGP